MSPVVAGKPDRGTALGLAMIARERRERELDRLWNNFFTLEDLAHRLNEDAAEYFPPLADRLLVGPPLSRDEKARVAILSEPFPLLPEYEELQSYFEYLGKAVRHE